MNMEWQLQEAKNHLSQLVNQASHEGPQIITIHGKPTAIVLSIEEYQQLISTRTKLTDFFQKSPLREIDITLERDMDLSREVDL